MFYFINTVLENQIKSGYDNNTYSTKLSISDSERIDKIVILR